MYSTTLFGCRYNTTGIQNGDKETRTLDPLRAKQVLSHLSYTPSYYSQWRQAVNNTARISIAVDISQIITASSPVSGFGP